VPIGFLKFFRAALAVTYCYRVIAREFKHLKRIETALAKKRKAEGQKAGGKARHGDSSLAENLPPSSDARDLAAAQLGISGKTAEKLEAVVDVIDQADVAGDTKRAAELRDALNTKSASAAIGLVQKKTPPKEKLLSLNRMASGNNAA